MTSKLFERTGGRSAFRRPQPKNVSDVITNTVTELTTRLSFSLNSRTNDQQPKQFLVRVAKTHSITGSTTKGAKRTHPIYRDIPLSSNETCKPTWCLVTVVQEGSYELDFAWALRLLFVPPLIGWLSFTFGLKESQRSPTRWDNLLQGSDTL